jgi:hypothetical protein
MPDDKARLKGEDEFYELWLGTQVLAERLADELGLTDEDLRQIVARWRSIGECDDHAMVVLASNALQTRLLRRVPPRDGNASLPGLALRLRGERRRK